MNKKVKKKIMTLALAAMLTAVSVMPAKAASEDVIDTSKTASLTIHKYDITAATQAGVNVDDQISTGKQNSEVEKKLADYAIKGVEFSYLRVGDVDTLSSGGNVKLIYEIPEALQKIIGLDTQNPVHTKDTKEYFTSQQINDSLKTALEDNTATKDKLEAYAADADKMALTDASGTTTKKDLALGLYLIVETKVPEDVVYTTNPWFVQLPMTDYEGESWFYDVVCYPKNQTGVPTLDKKVRNNPDEANITTAEKGTVADFTKTRPEYTYSDTVTASEGEKLDYKLVTKLPRITSSTTYLSKYTFIDVLSQGITYGKDAVIAFYDSLDKAESNVANVADSGAVAVWTKDSGKYTQDYSENDNGSAKMTVAMTADGLNEINKNYSEKYMVVYYTADVKSNNTVVTGDKGNPNDVSLEWRRTSQEYYDVLRDQSIVYTFGIDLQKKFSDNNGDATKVKFVLQNQKDNYYVKATGSNGVYYVNGKSATEAGATEFSPAADGTLLINGIEGDTYVMTETHSDTGYSLLKEPMIITINSAKADITATTANITGIQSKAGTESTANDSVVKGEALQNKIVVQTTAASATVDGTNATLNADKTTTDSEHGLVDMEVLNSKGFTLPKTGGDGLYLITILGVVLAGAGIAWSRKKNVAK